MNSFKKIYSIQGNTIEGNLKNLLNKVEEFSDLKLGLKTEEYEEILQLTDIAYTEDLIYGILPNHTSSHNLNKFCDDKDKQYNCFLIYFSNKNYAVLRSDLNSVPLFSTFQKSKYKYYNWFSNNSKYRLLFTSPNDFHDKNKKENLVRKIKNGANLKVRIEINNVKHILSPNITYLKKKNNQDIEISLKTNLLPIFNNFQNVDNQEIIKLQKLILNLDGNISVVEYGGFPTNVIIKKNIIIRVLNFILRTFKSKTILINENQINSFGMSKKIEWFIEDEDL